MGAPQPWPREPLRDTAAHAPGCCPEAQADGVPCVEIRDCEYCGRALLAPSAVKAEPETAIR